MFSWSISSFFFFWKVFRPLWNSWSLWDKLVRYISKTIDTFNNCGFFWNLILKYIYIFIMFENKDVF